MSELNKHISSYANSPSDAVLRKTSLLKERAKALASSNTEVVLEEGKIDFVEFRISNETYGIDTRFVKEIFLFNNFRKIPDTPDFMPGVINLHGKIVSLVDLKKLFSLDTETENSSKQTSLVISHGGNELALLIDSVIGIKPSSISEISKGFTSDKNTQDNYISSITSTNTIILDALRILNDSKLTVNIA